MKNKRLWILFGGIAFITLALLLFNFRAAVSNTQSNNAVMSTDSRDNMPYSMQRPEKISIGLVGEGPLVSALQKALAEKMNKTGLGKIELVQELKPTYQNPVLIVKLGSPGITWTPFFAASQLSIHAGYASNGDSTYVDVVEKTKTTIGNRDHSVLNMYAEYEVKESSWGLISRPGYHQYLADYLAQEIATGLKELYH